MACLAFPALLMLSVEIAWYHQLGMCLGFVGLLVGGHLGLWHNAMVKFLLVSFLSLLWNLKGSVTTLAYLAFYALRPITKLYLISTSIQKQPLDAWMRTTSSWGTANIPNG